MERSPQRPRRFLPAIFQCFYAPAADFQSAMSPFLAIYSVLSSIRTLCQRSTTVSLYLCQLTHSWRKNIPWAGPTLRCSPPKLLSAKQILYLHLPPHVRISPMFSTKCDFTTFASRTLYFHPLTDSFRKNRGVGYARPNNQMTSLFIPLQKGKKPRIAWGEAIRGLGDNYEDWAVRSSLRLSEARPL